MEFTFRQECSDCKYHKDGLCIHPRASYCNHCELWAPNWYKRDAMEDCLIVTYDRSSIDVPTLCIARKEKDKVRILNTIQGDEALYGYAWLTGFATLKKQTKQKKKRKYYRKCGICGERYEQSEMIRTNNSSNGWLCFDCHNAEHPEYEDFGEY